jgi:hypothetical protein
VGASTSGLPPEFPLAPFSGSTGVASLLLGVALVEGVGEAVGVADTLGIGVASGVGLLGAEGFEGAQALRLRVSRLMSTPIRREDAITIGVIGCRFIEPLQLKTHANQLRNSNVLLKRKTDRFWGDFRVVWRI